MYRELLSCAVDAAELGGSILVERYQSLSVSEVDLKGTNDYVTEVDRASESAIISLIRDRFPDHSILAEESGAHPATSGVRWIIDPLDGTTNYIHGFPVFGVSIAVEVDGKVAAATILDPSRKELFTAARGSGAFLNGKPIRVSSTSGLAQSLILTGFPFKANEYMEDFIQVFRELLPSTSGIRRCGAASIDFANLACGRADGFWEFGLGPWDIAAGALLIEEAGGRITDIELGDNHIWSGNVIASNGYLHEQLHEIISKSCA